MPRFIVRYRGKGERPREAVERVQRIRGAAVLVDSGRMMLVEAAEQALRNALAPERDWLIAPEVIYSVPDTRKKVRAPAKRS
jgi:hypothetical protein